MALTSFTSEEPSRPARFCGPVYAWSGFAVMWAFWISFVVFLADPRWAAHWPLPTVESGGIALHPALAALADLALIALFGLQHSVMARPWFKTTVMARLPAALERCTFVHAANLTLFALILFWQPIPIEIWHAPSPLREVLWAVFAAGWLILLLGALSFGIFELLGIAQMRAWYRGLSPPRPRLKIGLLYRWLPHPMYVGVLLAMWATPRLTVGHMLLAAGMTVYVLIAMRYEERDLGARFGTAYTRWRVPRLPPASVFLNSDQRNLADLPDARTDTGLASMEETTSVGRRHRQATAGRSCLAWPRPEVAAAAKRAFTIVLREQEHYIGLKLSHLSECPPTDGGTHIAAAQQARWKAFRETTSEGLLWKKVEDGASCARRR